MVGPTPQISLSELAGERNSVGLMLPSPNALRIPGAGDGWLMMGMDNPRDKVLVLVQRDRNHGLNIQDPLRRVVGADAEIKVVLERDANEVGNGVLSFPGQFFRFGIPARRLIRQRLHRQVREPAKLPQKK